MRLMLLVLCLLLASAGCDKPPTQFGTRWWWPWCEAQQPLKVECTAPLCLVGIAVDYLRAEPRGYRVLALEKGAPVNATAAETAARAYVTDVLRADPPDEGSAELAGDFYNCFLRYEKSNNSWLVVVHAASGNIVFAGLQVWANPQRSADPPLPTGWQDNAALGCTDGAADPESKMLVTTDWPIGSTPASTAEQAWDVAKRLNITEQFAAGRPYRAMVVSFSEAIGEFDPWTADWLVWLSHVP